MQEQWGERNCASMSRRTENRAHWEIEDDADCANYPERRLWLAVIVQALEDYEGLLQRIESAWNQTRRPVNRQLWIEACEVRRHCEHSLFEAICEHAGIPHRRILLKLNHFDREYCFNVIPVETRAEIRSAWQIRQFRKHIK